MNKIVKCLFLFLSLNALSAAQMHPFPQSIKYPYGFVPTTIDIDWVKKEYDTWVKKSGTLVSCGSDKLYINAGNEYKVEAVGFAALIFAYMGDSTRFAHTYNFYKSNLTSASGGMMGWHGSCNGPSDQGGATDGDIDVAFGLIIASWQWPTVGYLEKAISVIKVLKKMVVDCKSSTGEIKALTMGYNWGGCSMTDISYYNPAAFREFAKVIGNSEDSLMWVKLADDTYTILNANATTGLVSDRQNVTGAPTGGYGNYGDDACRTPWRITLDYLWNGNEKAKEWCIKVSNFAKGKTIKKISGPLSQSGGTGSSHESKYVGGFVIAAMANSQELVDEFAEEMLNINDTWNWFTYVLKFCYLITLTGNQWRNDLLATGTISQEQKAPDVSLDQIQWKLNVNRGVSISGLQPGYTVTLTDLSGKQLYSGITRSSMERITVSSMKNGCLVLTIKNQNKKIVKSGLMPAMRSN